eukprot:sb/3465766/
MAIFSEGGTSVPDFPLMIFFILLAMIAIPLNLLVLRHNYWKNSSIARDLYLVLGTVDLFTCPIIGIGLAVGLWKQKDPACFDDITQSDICEDQYYYYLNRNGTEICLIYSYAYLFCYDAPLIITSYLTVARFLQIRFPFREIPRKPFFGSLLICLGSTAFVHGFSSFYAGYNSKESVFLNYCQICYPHNGLNISGFYISPLSVEIISVVPRWVFQSAGAICSALTVLHLFKRFTNPVSNGTAQSLRSTFRVLFMNGLSLFSMCIAFVGDQLVIRSRDQLSKYSIEIEMQSRPFSLMILLFVAYVVLTPLNSFLNPIIYIAMSRGSIFKNNRNTIRTEVASVNIRNPVFRCEDNENKTTALAEDLKLSVLESSC